MNGVKTTVALSLLVTLATFVAESREIGVLAAQAAQKSIFLVRHAERADGGGPAGKGADPSLSDEGKQRAASLAQALADVQIRAIFVTEYKRTQETAVPLAKTLGITPVIVAGNDTPALLSRLRQSSGNALVIGHSNTLPEVIKALGVETPVEIPDPQYDNLFIVMPGPPTGFLRLHYR